MSDDLARALLMLSISAIFVIAITAILRGAIEIARGWDSLAEGRR